MVLLHTRDSDFQIRHKGSKESKEGVIGSVEGLEGVDKMRKMVSFEVKPIRLPGRP